MKYTYKDLKQGYIFWFFIIGILFVLGSFGCLISNAESYGYTTDNFPDEYYDEVNYIYNTQYEYSYTCYNSSVASLYNNDFYKNIYFSISCPKEVVAYIGYGSNDVFASFGFCTEIPSNENPLPGYLTSHISFKQYALQNDQLIIDTHLNYRDSRNYTNYQNSNRYFCYHEWTNLSTQDYPYTYKSLVFDFPVNMKVFENRESAYKYLYDGSLDGLLDNPNPPEPPEPVLDNSIALENFTVKTYDSADFDNFYFDFRYDLSDEIKNNLDDAILELKCTYNGVIVDKITQKPYSFNSPYHETVSVPLSMRSKGFPSKLNDNLCVNDYLEDSVSFFGKRPEHKMKRLIIGIDDNWVDYASGKPFRVDTSKIQYTLTVYIDGRKSQPYIFNYDFVKKSGNTTIPDSENPDEPPIDEPTDTIPDSTDADGNGVINSIDIRNTININIGDGENLYYDIEPEDYNNLIDNIGNAINPQKENGLFSLLKDFLTDFPIELKLCLIGSLSAIALVSIVKILRG